MRMPAHGVGVRQPATKGGQIAFVARPEQEVPMIGHKYIGQDSHGVPLQRGGQDTLEGGVIGGCFEQGGPGDGAIEHVVDEAAGSMACGARHGRRICRGRTSVKKKRAASPFVLPEPSAGVLAVNDALERFEKIDPLKANLVKLRYFAGLTIPQAAEALGISATTADRYWAYSRAWLHAELKKAGADRSG